jgi:hypothetical protein
MQNVERHHHVKELIRIPRFENRRVRKVDILNLPLCALHSAAASILPKYRCVEFFAAQQFIARVPVAGDSSTLYSRCRYFDDLQILALRWIPSPAS